MFKQSPSRNHRSKGIKVKHILQICLLLAVCFWLVYQVKRSHEKKSEFDSEDRKVVGQVEDDIAIQRFGRKDLPRVSELATDLEKHGEDEEEKEWEEEDSKHEEPFDGGRGGGDDEIDENDTERADTEPEHEEESVDEDKEREDKEGDSEDNQTRNEVSEEVLKEDNAEDEDSEGDGKEDHTEPKERGDVREDHNESDGASEDHDREGVNTDTQEAREEQYKADDASSEVAHDMQTVIPETGNLTSGHASEIWQKVSFGQVNDTQTRDKDDPLLQSGVQSGQDTIESTSSSNATAIEQKKLEIDSNKSENIPLQNSTLPSVLNNHPENRTASTDMNGEDSASLLPNEAQTELPSGLSQNATEGRTHEEEHASKLEAAELSINITENVNSNAGEALNSSNTKLDPALDITRTDAMAGSEDNSSHLSQNSSKSETSAGSDESSQSHSSDEGAGVVQHEQVDASHISLTQEEIESRTDLNTLRNIKTEVQSTGGTVSE